MTDSSSPITWRKPDGSVVSCFEKVKVLNENYTELRELLQDSLDDALLMGCSEAQVREAFRQLIDSIQAALRAHGTLSFVDYPGYETLDPPDMET